MASNRTTKPAGVLYRALVPILLLCCPVGGEDCEAPAWDVPDGWHCNWTVQYIPVETGLHVLVLGDALSDEECWERHYWMVEGRPHAVAMSTEGFFKTVRLTVTPPTAAETYTEFTCPEVFHDGFDSGGTENWS